MKLDEFEAEVFKTAHHFLAANADRISSQLRASLSCEPFLNHLFAKAFDNHRFICVREVPYMDLDGRTGKSGLDIMVIAPDKQRSVLVETKLVHDNTLNSYRARASKDGSSIAGDLEKLRPVPQILGRTKLVMVLMVSVSGAETSSDWRWWLAEASPLRETKWLRLEIGDGPLFDLPPKGWCDILIHRVD